MPVNEKELRVTTVGKTDTRTLKGQVSQGILFWQDVKQTAGVELLVEEPTHIVSIDELVNWPTVLSRAHRSNRQQNDR